MKLRFQILDPSNGGNPIGGNAGTPIDDTNTSCSIAATKTDDKSTSGNIDFSATLLSTSLDAFASSPVKFIDNEGYMHTSTVSYDSTAKIVTVDLPLYNINHSVIIKITISKPDYKDFVKSFVVYGYDLGNASGMSVNPDFKIYLISDTDENYPFNSSLIYQVPFTNKILIYKTDSANYDVIKYTLSNGITVSNIADFQFDPIDDFAVKVFSSYTYFDDPLYITNEYNDISHTAYSMFDWIPKFNVGANCMVNCSDCFTKESQIFVNMDIDYENYINIRIDDTDYIPSRWLRVSMELYHNSGALELEQNDVHAPILGSVNSLNFPTFQLSDVGDYLARGIVGTFYNFPEQIVSGILDIGYYLILNDEGLDVSNMTIVGTATFGNVIEVQVQDTPNFWGMGVLVPVVNTSNVANIYDKSFYRVIDATNILLDGNTVSNTQIFFYDSTVNTLTIGTDGYLVRVGSYKHCYRDIIIKGCEIFDVDRTACNQYKVYNRGSFVLPTSIYKLDVTGWVLHTSFEISPFGTQELFIANDGVYKIYSEYGEYPIVNICQVETCVQNYMNKLICCNLETNCTDNSTTTRAKDIYYFNAFSTLLHMLYSMINDQFNFSIVFGTITSETLTSLYDIDKVIAKLKSYCSICKEPCKP